MIAYRIDKCSRVIMIEMKKIRKTRQKTKIGQKDGIFITIIIRIIIIIIILIIDGH